MTSLLLPMHLMAMLALGLLIGQQRWSRAVLVVYGAALLAGFGAIVAAYVPVFAEESLLAATALMGLALAWARLWREWSGAALAAGTGLALAFDSPPEVLSLARANLELAVTAVGVVVAVWAIALFGRWLSSAMAHLGVRILGSWIAASALLVLALRLLR